MSDSAAAPSPSSPAVRPATPSTTAYSHTGSQTSGSALAANGLVNGDAESPKMATTATDPTFFALNLSSYIFNVGYIGSNWADIELTFFGTGAKLHRIMLARSPYLLHLMMNVAPGASIPLSFTDPNISAEAVHIALQHLYDPAQHLVKPDNARSVLVTAYFFQGMPELVHHAYTVCRENLSSERILEYVQWLGPGKTSAPNGCRDTSTMYGSVMVEDGRATVADDASESWVDEGYARYGEWSVRLKQDVLDYLIRTLPASVLESSASLSTDPQLLSIYAQLPFDLFKLCVESPLLPIDPSRVQDRFVLAKKAIAQRKKLGASGKMEEIVALAFNGGEEGSVVHITRRSKRKSTLYKVEG